MFTINAGSRGTQEFCSRRAALAWAREILRAPRLFGAEGAEGERYLYRTQADRARDQEGSRALAVLTPIR